MGAGLDRAKIERVGDYYFVDIDHNSGISDSALYVFLDIQNAGNQVVSFPRKNVERKLQLQNNNINVLEKSAFKSVDVFGKDTNEWIHVASVKVKQ